MSTNPDMITAPSWHDRRVVWFQGQHDSLIKLEGPDDTKEAARARAEASGECYRTISLIDIFNFAPTNKKKGFGPAFLPSSYDMFDARSHDAQRDRGIFHALTGDIDKGDHDAADITKAMQEFAPGCACLIHSSANSRPGNRRWRIFVPLLEPVSFYTWKDAQSAFFQFMEARGVPMDKALGRGGQPVYLPNVPDVHEESGTELRSEDGKPLYYRALRTKDTLPGIDLATGIVATGIAAIRQQRAIDEQAREKVRLEAERMRANSPQGDGSSLIDDFNAANSVESMLEKCGYEQSTDNPADWKSPLQTGNTFATRVMNSKWVSLSQSDTDAGIGSKHEMGCWGDAFDLFVHFKNGGDRKGALRTLGAERRSANVIYPAKFERVPDWMSEIPMPDEAPEWVQGEGENFDGEYSLDDPETEIPASDGKPRLPFFWFNDATPNLEANDFVEDLLTTGAMSVVYGPSNCGKTFFIVDMALHVAWGREWRGRAVDKGAIVYLSLEGAQGIRNRLAAFKKHHDITGGLPFVAMPKPINLLNEDADLNAVIELTRFVEAETGLPVAMVIVDTLSRAMAGGNENSPEDMTAIVANCDKIRSETGAHVCIVHHSGKDEARGARGHSSLRAATDTEIEIKRDPEVTQSTVRIAKQRDLEAGEPFAFTLQGVALGTNRRGKDVTSCVVLPAEATTVLARDPDKLSPKETAALDSLERCLAVGAFEIETGHNGDVTQAVTLHAWRRSMQALDVIARNNENMARTQYHRIKKGLERKGQIGTDGTNVWIA